MTRSTKLFWIFVCFFFLVLDKCPFGMVGFGFFFFGGDGGGDFFPPKNKFELNPQVL